ncbi:hypothetical protein ACIA8R_45555 [Nonomuraea sp. NPDC051191]|uniref:hypothetical protein n=1 Tax=Nonomuraea sp. NPDC051191 TaxID=3364372 RepID=UPI0037A6B18C
MSTARLTPLLRQILPVIPDGAEVRTATLDLPPGDPSTPPHRHSGPVFGHLLEGELLFELEGEPPRVMRQHAPRNLVGHLTAMARSGDLADVQGDVRQEATRQQARTAAGDRRSRPCRPHGEPGGADLRPRSGSPWCPLCRAGRPGDHLAPTGTGG